MNHIVLNGNLDNTFQISEQKYAKADIVAGHHIYKRFSK